MPSTGPPRRSAEFLRRKALPNALTAARVVLTLAAYPVAFAQDKALFAVLVLAIVLTDILDGPIARRLGVADGTGANLDSASDFLFYASLPFWAYLFQPAFIVSMLWVIGPVFVLYLVANVLNRLRRGRIGFHNRVTRTAGTAGVIYAMWIILFGAEPLLFYAMMVVLVVDLVYRFIGAFTAPRLAGSES